MDSQSRFEERLAALRDAYIGGLPERLTAMRAALAAGDRDRVRSEAHRLAGTGVSYSVPELSSWGRAVERLCKTGAATAELTIALDQLAALLAALTTRRATASE